MSAWRRPAAPERGSEIVQSVVAVSVVLAVVFSVVQVGGMMLSINRLTADLTRACRQMDSAGLALAADKERFVEGEVLGAATQLKPDLLRVSNVRMEDAGESRASRAPSGAAALAQGGALREGPSPGAEAFDSGPGATPRLEAAVGQRTDAARVSFDVAYELPSLAAIPGLAHRTVARHVVCEHVAGRVVEVEVGS